MKSTICLVTKWTQKTCGLFEADSVFLIEKGACATVKYVALHLEGKIGHAPERIADALVNMWKQALVI